MGNRELWNCLSPLDLDNTWPFLFYCFQATVGNTKRWSCCLHFPIPPTPVPHPHLPKPHQGLDPLVLKSPKTSEGHRFGPGKNGRGPFSGALTSNFFVYLIAFSLLPQLKNPFLVSGVKHWLSLNHVILYPVSPRALSVGTTKGKIWFLCFHLLLYLPFLEAVKQKLVHSGEESNWLIFQRVITPPIS